MYYFKMGFFFSKLWNNKKAVRILLVGLDADGKTTILHKLGKEEKEKVKILPTIGFYVESLDYKDWNFITFDLGGADKMRLLFRHFYQNTEGLIFVVDSNDRDRIEDAADELKKMLSEEELKDCCVLVMANKQDLNGALSPDEVTKALGMESLIGRTWFVQGTSATTGQGLEEGLNWMASVLLKNQ